jgi:eukaryotic-like serine/threonine-protein kinase
VKPDIPMARKGLYEFGPFRLDCAKHLLLKHGQPLQLPPKAFEILALLVQRRGALMAKGELLQAVWPDTFVEENNLTQYVSMIRKTLGEINDQKYIQTVPKLGYRFVSDVRDVGDEADLLVAKHTRTRIVVREEQEEEGDFAAGPLPVMPEGEQQLARAEPVTITSAPRGALATARARSRKNQVLAFAVIAIAAIAVAVLSLAEPSRHNAERASTTPDAIPAPVKPRYSIAVLGFKNLSGRADDEWVSAALAEMLTTELSGDGQLRIVSGEDVHRIESDLKVQPEQTLAKPTLTQIRNRVGADLTVSGSYVEVGREPNRQIRLDLRLQDTVVGETIFSSAVTGRTQELFALVSRSGSELRSKLGTAELTTSEQAENQAALPSTPETARLYSQGLVKLRKFDAPAAQKILTKAVAGDPNFALGHSALASAWSALGYDEKAKTEARRALDLSSNLTRQEHLMIAAQYSELTRDWDQSVVTYKELFALFPDSVDYGVRLASAQTSAGKGNDALGTLAKLRKLPAPGSQDPQIDLAGAAVQESLGNFQQELDASSRAIQNGEALDERLLIARSWIRKSWALRRLGQTPDAAQGLLEAKRIFAEAGDIQGVASTLHLMGGAESEQGDFAPAARSYQEAIAIFRQIGDRRALAMSINGLAIVQYERGDLSVAKTLYEQYHDIEQEVGSKINAAGALGNIANVDDAQGDLAEARKLNEDSLKTFAEVGDQRAMGTALGNLALILCEQGDLSGAREKFNQALDITRKIGCQRGVAYDLAGLSDILRAQGDLAAAEEQQQASLTIRNQLGEKHNMAANRLSLAVLALEERKPADARTLASEAAVEFEKDKSPDDEAAAEEVVARSFLAQGKLSEGQAAIDRTGGVARRTSNLPLTFDISATSARIKIARKNPPNPSSVVTAEKELESSLATAHKCGYLEYEYKLDLALGEIEFESGDAREGRARLEALVIDATKRGFGLIARDAAAILKSQPALNQQAKL